MRFVGNDLTQSIPEALEPNDLCKPKYLQHIKNDNKLNLYRTYYINVFALLPLLQFANSLPFFQRAIPQTTVGTATIDSHRCNQF